MTTIDAHEDKIWALATPQEKSNQFDTFATGAADGQIKIWRDCTKEKEEEELERKEQLFLQEQEFQKALQNGDYKQALRLAPGDRIVLTGGTVNGTSGNTNLIRVDTIQ